MEQYCYKHKLYYSDCELCGKHVCIKCHSCISKKSIKSKTHKGYRITKKSEEDENLEENYNPSETKITNNKRKAEDAFKKSKESPDLQKQSSTTLQCSQQTEKRTHFNFLLTSVHTSPSAGVDRNSYEIVTLRSYFHDMPMIFSGDWYTEEDDKMKKTTGGTNVEKWKGFLRNGGLIYQQGGNADTTNWSSKQKKGKHADFHLIDGSFKFISCQVIKKKKNARMKDLYGWQPSGMKDEKISDHAPVLLKVKPQIVKPDDEAFLKLRHYELTEDDSPRKSQRKRKKTEFFGDVSANKTKLSLEPPISKYIDCSKPPKSKLSNEDDIKSQEKLKTKSKKDSENTDEDIPSDEENEISTEKYDGKKAEEKDEDVEDDSDAQYYSSYSEIYAPLELSKWIEVIDKPMDDLLDISIITWNINHLGKEMTDLIERKIEELENLINEHNPTLLLIQEVNKNGLELLKKQFNPAGYAVRDGPLVISSTDLAYNEKANDFGEYFPCYYKTSQCEVRTIGAWNGERGWLDRNKVVKYSTTRPGVVFEVKLKQ